MRYAAILLLVIFLVTGCDSSVQQETATTPVTEATTEATTEITTESTTQASTEVETPVPAAPVNFQVSRELFDVIYDFEYGSGKGFGVTTEEQFTKEIQELKNIFPDGYYWNHCLADMTTAYKINGVDFHENFRVTGNPCYEHTDTKDPTSNVYFGASDQAYDTYIYSCQCKGFANLISDIMFGKDAPVRRYTDYGEIKVGDQVRFNFHTAVIIAVTPEYIEVLECNADMKTCSIGWGRKVPRTSLDNAWYISRWSNR